MNLQKQFAEFVLENHSGNSVIVLERLEIQAVVDFLLRASPSSTASIIQKLSPQYQTAVVNGMNAVAVKNIVDLVSTENAVRILRRADEMLREDVLALFEPKIAALFRAMIGFREGTAGAVMDPDAMAFPQEFSVEDALDRIQEQAKLSRHNIYVVDQEQHLVGVVNLTELMIAPLEKKLFEVMTGNPFQISATADRAQILRNPGWLKVHALPVVDADNCFLGVIPYRTMRDIEAALSGARSSDADAGVAIGQVISAAASGVLDALGGATDNPRVARHD